jgi:hypothetical protein
LDAHGTASPGVLSTGAEGGPTIAYAGLEAGQLNVLQLLERQRRSLWGGESHACDVPVRWSDLRRGIFPDADLVVIGGEAAQIDRLPRHRAYIAPLRVHLVVDTSTGMDAMRARISKRERWEFSRGSRRHGWELEVDDDDAGLRDFYYGMHLPTMQVRHAEQTRTEPLAVAKAICDRGRLFFVREGDHRVAGALCHLQPAHGRLVTRLLGVRGGDAQHYESGAFKALYHLILAWAVEHDVGRVDLFGTEAFIAKGIFQWKRRLGAEVVLPGNHWRSKRLYVRPQADTPMLRDFLVANPLLTLAPDGMQPVYFFDAERPVRTDISAKVAGVLEPKLADLEDVLC